MDPPSPHSFPPGYMKADIGGRVIAVSIAFIPICLTFAGLRFYSQWLRQAPKGLDDLFVVISVLMLIGWSIIGICTVKFAGVGRHLPALMMEEPAVVTVYFKYLLVMACYYYTLVAVPKLAVLALYNRLLTIEPYRTIIRILAAILITSAIVIVVMALNLCHPFEANWNPFMPGAKCMNQQAFYTYASLPNIITDVAMLILPMPAVWKLHASKKVKTGLIATFLLGSLGLVTSILRFVIFTRGSAIKDGTWSATQLMIWSLIEPNVYLISACLPAMRPLLNLCFGDENSRLGTRRKYGSSRYNSKPKSSTSDSSGVFQSSASKPVRSGPSLPYNNPFDAALYGDEIQLVSVAEKDAEGRYDEESVDRDRIVVQKGVDVVVNNARSLDGRRAGPGS